MNLAILQISLYAKKPGGIGLWRRVFAGAGRGRAARVRFGLRLAGDLGGLGGMGAKYLPNVRDLKASQRYRQRQADAARLKKLPGAPVAPRAKRK